MQKALETTAAIKMAWVKARELGHAIGLSIYSSGELIQVHLREMRDMEQIPGEVEFREFDNPNVEPFTHEAVKMFDGVKFFTMLTEEQYEALKAS